MREAIDLAKQIEEVIEDRVSERTRDKHASYFEDIFDKSQSIADTIRKTNRVSPAQLKALENMLGGVKKWVHND